VLVDVGFILRKMVLICSGEAPVSSMAGAMTFAKYSS
jgi:hypothetical protein